MFLERPEKMTENDWLAVKVADVKEALNGASNAMKMTPFFVARDRDDLLERLDMFAADLGAGAQALTRVSGVDDIEFDREASGRDIIADMLLAAPDEKKVRQVFDRARGQVWFAIDALKDAAKKNAEIPERAARDGLMLINALNNVVRGTQDFYRRVPASAAQDFIFR